MGDKEFNPRPDTLLSETKIEANEQEERAKYTTEQYPYL